MFCTDFINNSVII